MFTLSTLSTAASPARGSIPWEFTCRFGYPGFSILEPLQACGWDELFRRTADRNSVAGFLTRDGFALGVVLAVPPFPYSAGYEKLSKGLPVILRADLSELDRPHLHSARWRSMAIA